MDGDLFGGVKVSRRGIEEVDGSGCSVRGEYRERSFDRLSSLPKSLLIHILSYLDTRKAASTSVLSKRWKYLWTDLPSLSFRDGIIEPHNWKHLTKLLIEEVELHEDVIQKILLGCPVLYTLNLDKCWGFERLHIDSKSLYELSIYDCGDEDEGGFLEISAPHLCSLCVTNFPISEKELSIKNIPSLVRAVIGFSKYCEGSDVVVDNVMELLRKLHRVKELETDHSWDQILCDMVVMGLQFPRSSRKSLTLDVWGYGSLPGILALLESSPQLETLFLEWFDNSEDSNVDSGQIAKDRLNCDLMCLKTVHLAGYADLYWGSKPMVTLAQTLLRRATVLEKMVVEHWPDEAARIVRALRSYPKSSQNATITVLPERKFTNEREPG